MLLGQAGARFLKLASKGACVFALWAGKMCQVFVTSCAEDCRLLGIHCLLFLVGKKKPSENKHSNDDGPLRIYCDVWLVFFVILPLH